jgi:uncharacterized membrane protein YeaQ/YmgE (transglycosylase-associated protein family)
MLFADVVISAGGIATWLVVGLIAGWLAGKVMEEASYGIIGDLLLGLAGGLIGGAVFGFFVEGEPFFWGSVLVAFVGACILIALVRIIASARRT